MVNAALEQLHDNYVETVEDSNLRDWTSKDDWVESVGADSLEQNPWLPRVLLFTDKSQATAMFKSLALNMRNRMVVGQTKVSDDNSKEVISQFEKNVPGLFDTGGPKLVILTEEGQYI